ncbi:MAG: CoA transferase [Dehalococcoidia bacterium]|nr:MAG: CoA transferase [Dehalococcoidia bacterium]
MVEDTPALREIRVLDIAWTGAGLFCSLILGDLGADIIKIHETDPERRSEQTAYALSGMSGSLGLRNCRTMGLDLTTEAGLSVFNKLVATSDVFIESSKPGDSFRFGIDYDTVAKINPRIVYVSLSGYGQDGPYRDIAGHDINYISIGGLLGLTGVAGGPPIIPGTLVADFAAGGMAAVIAILAALLGGTHTGRGQYIDVSLTDGIVEMMSVWINPYLTWGVLSKRGEAWLMGYWPWYNVYETSDGGHISIGSLEPWFYANLCQLLNREDLVEHQYTEGDKRDEIFRYFKETFRKKTRDEWLEILRSRDICAAPVYSIDEVVNDPQLIARGMIGETPHPVLGDVKQVGSMFKLSNSLFQVRNWCTQFGQHTDEILSQLGYNTVRINALRQAQVIG